MKAVRLRPLRATHEHEFEAAPGLPEPLPPGERLLWQGAPKARAIARHALHGNLLAAYFIGLIAWHGFNLARSGVSPAQALAASGSMLMLTGLISVMVLGFALLVSRTTVYTLTDRRVVMRIGTVLGLTLNLPLARIERVDWRTQAGGTGDFALQLAGRDRIAWLHLWPHARAWHLRHPQPLMRGIANPEALAALLLPLLQRAHPSTHATDSANDPAGDQAVSPPRCRITGRTATSAAS